MSRRSSYIPPFKTPRSSRRGKKVVTTRGQKYYRSQRGRKGDRPTRNAPVFGMMHPHKSKRVRRDEREAEREAERLRQEAEDQDNQDYYDSLTWQEQWEMGGATLADIAYEA